jgi:arsenate reductase
LKRKRLSIITEKDFSKKEACKLILLKFVLHLSIETIVLMKKILVVSQRNSCRSQIAEGWLSYYGKGAAEVTSAGIVPTELDLNAADAMSDAIIDISAYKSKGIAQVAEQEFDYVIVLSAETQQILPIFKGNPRVYEYPFPDVVSQDLSEDEKKKAYAELRDELENFCFDFIHHKIKALI